MKQRDLLFACALLPLSAFAACGGGDSASSDGGGGSGESEGGAGGDTGTGGSSGCAQAGKGTIVVEVSGLPSGVDADVSLEGPGAEFLAAESVMFEELGAGTYSVRAVRVTDSDPIVRTVFDPVMSSSSFCLKQGDTQTLSVAYEAIPSSNKLWTESNGDYSLTGFASALLEASGDPPATVTVDAPAGRDVAFDRDGNLWSVGPTTADPHLVRFPAAALGSSGGKERDRGIVIEEIPCGPEIRALAFDATGNLWVSTCGDRVVRLTPGELATSGEVTPAVVISEVVENGNLAFDVAGNLWVVSDGAIARYDAARLDASDAAPADLVLSVTNPDDTNLLTASDLVFDAAGNLWATDFGGNLVFRIGETDLGGTGEENVAAEVRLAIGVSSLIDRPAFDESGAFWIGLGANGFGRLTPEQLEVTTGPGDPTIPEVVVTSADLGSVGRVAFFPAAAELPLYHALD